MSTNTIAAKIAEINSLSYAGMKSFITRNNLNIKKNLSSPLMRTQIIGSILSDERNLTRKAKEEAMAREEAWLAANTPLDQEQTEALESFLTGYGNYLEADEVVSKAISKENKSKRKYFVTFEMQVWDSIAREHKTTLFSFVSSSKNPAEEARARFTKWIYEQPNARAYPDQFEAMKQLSKMNIPIKTKAERAILDALTGTYQGKDLIAKSAEITRYLKQKKYKTVLYREIRRIDGFPDKIDKKDGRCVPNFLITDLKYKPHEIKAWFDNYYKDDAVYNLPTMGFDNHKFTTLDLVEFAAGNKHSYYLLDRTNFCFDYAVVPKSGKRALFAMIEDSHIYPIESNTARKSICRKIEEANKCANGANKNSTIAQDHAVQKRCDNPINYIPIVTEDMIFNNKPNSKGFIENTIYNKSYVQTSGDNLNHIAGWFTSRGIIPSVEYSTRGVSKVSFEQSSTVCAQITLNNEWDELDGTDYETLSDIVFAKFDELRTEHPEIITANYGGVAPAKYWIGCDIAPETHYGMDFSKYYYNCALRLTDQIPVFSVGSKQQCDKFTDDNSFYYIITEDERLFRGSDYYTCEVIRLAISENIPFRVDHKLVPHDIYDPELIKSKLQEIVDEFDGDETRAKKALVRFIGMLARNKTTKTEAYLISDDEDNTGSLLYHYLTELSRGKEVQAHLGAFPRANMITSTKKGYHSISCGTAHRAIINRSYIEMYLFLKQNNLWDHVDGIKTDCVLVSKHAFPESKIKEMIESSDIPMKLETPKKCSPCNLEVFYPEDIVEAPIDLRSSVEIKRESQYINQLYDNALFPTDGCFQWMDLLMNDICSDILNRLFIRIEGIAGAGKSFIAKQICTHFRKLGYKVMNLAPDWVAANNIGGKTFHTQFQLEENSDLWFKQIVCRDLSNTIVIIDEVSKLDRNLISVVDFIRKRAFAVVVMGDCAHQLLPVKKSPISVEDSLREMVESYYLLEVCKRGIDIMKPALQVFNGVDSKTAGYNHMNCCDTNELAYEFTDGNYEKAICKSNATRNAFNAAMVDNILTNNPQMETIEISFETNVTVSKKATLKTKAFVGMKLVSICNNKKLGLNKASTGTVICLKPFTVAIDGIVDPIVFHPYTLGIFDSKCTQVSKLFNLGYAITCYKSQGSTLSHKYLILDYSLMDERERFVALTRATSFNNITIAELN